MFFENGLQIKIAKAKIIIDDNLKSQKELTRGEAENLLVLGMDIAENPFSIQPKIYYFNLLDAAKRATTNPKAKVIYTFLTTEFQKQCQPLLNDPDELMEDNRMQTMTGF